VISLCILQVISTGFNMLSVDPQLTLAIWEGILFTVLALQAAWPKLALVLRGME
jgi:ribose/xylose/arabinose/galactoside ABC-type transport system permease subunit